MYMETETVMFKNKLVWKEHKACVSCSFTCIHLKTETVVSTEMWCGKKAEGFGENNNMEITTEVS